MPVSDFIPLLLASGFSTRNIQGKVWKANSEMSRPALGLLVLPTETLGLKPTGFRLVIAAIPAITWKKDKST